MKKTTKRRLLAILLPTSALLVLAVLILIGQTFRFDEREVQIDTPEGVLTGVLALPQEHEQPVGLVIFVHGDGPTNATYDDAYKPLWEAFAQEGYASLSLDKRGIGGSEGSWLNQSMEDRARDTLYTIQWAKSQREIDPKRIGLWGASQAGWVIPKVVRDEPGLQFAILVAPAINWIQQGQYNTRATLIHNGASTAQMAEKEQQDAKVLQLLRQGASYETYRSQAAAGESSPLSRERWTFILKNVQEDATEQLDFFKQPVHLVLGGRDLNVDSEDTEKVYRSRISPQLLSVTRLPDADHSMLKRRLSESNTWTVLTAVFRPRELFDEGYLSDMKQFLHHMKEERR